jgi:hypothetical protein
VSSSAPDLDEGVSVTLVLPRRCVEWLDLESVRRKHALGQGKSSKAPIVVELIDREIAAQGKELATARKK